MVKWDETLSVRNERKETASKDKLLNSLIAKFR